MYNALSELKYAKNYKRFSRTHPHGRGGVYKFVRRQFHRSMRHSAEAEIRAELEAEQAENDRLAEEAYREERYLEWAAEMDVDFDDEMDLVIANMNRNDYLEHREEVAIQLRMLDLLDEFHNETDPINCFCESCI